MLGVLLIDKPLGCTSHDVVNDLRHRLHTKRVGHAGTLDPLATGLLVAAVGPATRFLQYLPLEPKEYVAEITFGRTTTTYDREGDIVSEMDVPSDLLRVISEKLPQFLGLIPQIPPMYSAVKVGGKALYKYARAGTDVAREPRNVHIGAFDVEPIDGETIRARIVCSGGTYIRTLAHDLGQAVGCGAYLSALRRTRVGRFEVEQAHALDAIEPSLLLPLSEALKPMPMLVTSEQQTQNVREGRQIGLLEMLDSPLVALIEPGNGVFSVARVHGNLLQPECVIPSEAMNGTL
ncbi:MAG TPA: tRNA pseudouridine(55) synthase TruB [Fimbriimonadaceae bacterium]|nr:tRNA pseudouridine(55) synthase TruB [Fimbriimonadaceae bacterium]